MNICELGQAWKVVKRTSPSIDIFKSAVATPAATYYINKWTYPCRLYYPFLFVFETYDSAYVYWRELSTFSIPSGEFKIFPCHATMTGKKRTFYSFMREKEVEVEINDHEFPDGTLFADAVKILGEEETRDAREKRDAELAALMSLCPEPSPME